MKKNTTKIGNLSQVAITYALMAKGYTVLNPVGDGCRYDLAIDDGTSILRVQCKTGRVCGDVIEFRCVSNSSAATLGRNYIGQIDYFAVWCAQLSKAYLVPVGESTNGKCHMRLSPTRNNRTKGIRFAVEYEI